MYSLFVDHDQPLQVTEFAVQLISSQQCLWSVKVVKWAAKSNSEMGSSRSTERLLLMMTLHLAHVSRTSSAARCWWLPKEHAFRTPAMSFPTSTATNSSHPCHRDTQGLDDLDHQDGTRRVLPNIAKMDVSGLTYVPLIWNQGQVV